MLVFSFRVQITECAVRTTTTLKARMERTNEAGARRTVPTLASPVHHENDPLLWASARLALLNDQMRSGKRDEVILTPVTT